MDDGNSRFGGDRPAARSGNRITLFGNRLIVARQKVGFVRNRVSSNGTRSLRSRLLIALVQFQYWSIETALLAAPPVAGQTALPARGEPIIIKQAPDKSRRRLRERV